MKTIWLYNELPIFRFELRPLISKLKEEFLEYNSDYFTTFSKGEAYNNPLFDSQSTMSKKDAWRVSDLRYAWPERNIVNNCFADPAIAKRFPTATALVTKYIDHCNVCSYSSMEANSNIIRHTDLENRDRKFVRIHVPLIIPEGDVFLEVNGVVLKWDNIFAFDNAGYHSAYNNTSERRLIFILDLSRKLLGIPPEIPYDLNSYESMPQFVRKT